MIGDNIKAARLEAGLTQKQLAERIGVTQWYIYIWEHNKHRPRYEYQVKLASALNKSLDDIRFVH
jgi:Predicted transcriptional regulators